MPDSAMLHLKKRLGEGWSLPFFFVYLGMEINKVIELLGDKIFTVSFTKKDGSITLMNALSGEYPGRKSEKASNDNGISFFKILYKISLA